MHQTLMKLKKFKFGSLNCDLVHIATGNPNVELLLVILTKNINILVFYTSIYLQFIYKLIFICDLFKNEYYF